MSLPDRPLGRIVRREDAGAWLDGHAFLAAARTEARRLMDDAGGAHEQACLQGFEQGLQEGRQHMADALAHQQARFEHWVAQAEPALADLALNIARQLIGDLSPQERLLALARQAMNSFATGGALTLQVPPATLEPAREWVANAGLALQVQADPLLQADQVQLSDGLGSVALGVDTQLHQLRNALLPFADRPSPGRATPE
jgi:type III secretion protein L